MIDLRKKYDGKLVKLKERYEKKRSECWEERNTAIEKIRTSYSNKIKSLESRQAALSEKNVANTSPKR